VTIAIVRLSPHFTLDELAATSNKALAAANREEALAYVESLRALCTTLLEPVRAMFGPVKINSGFRGATLNAAVGGSKTSQHTRGEAADFYCPSAKLARVMEWIAKESGLPFGQVILERPRPGSEWIHLSLGAPWRPAATCGQALTNDGKVYAPYRG
jgi:uncharacterized protein YcbK (DUF882 family)